MWDNKLLGVSATGLFFLSLDWGLRLGPSGRTLLRILRKNSADLSPSKRRQLLHHAATKIAGHVHNMVALPLAFYLLLFEPALREDPFYASTPLAYRLVVWSAGYFVHDVVNVVSNYDLEGFGFLVHSFFCCALFCYGVFTMQCQYFGASFLTWEFSTPFVHLRWFLFEMGLKDSRLYFYNGLAMIASFFAARNVLGLYFSYVFWAASELELGSPRPGGFPAWGVHSFRAANVCLNLLNAFWLFKMLTKAAKALRGSDKDD
uniref:Tlc domain-containing protein n=1 Tax=Tetraselmis sp. GSL018 TaxID=582737 RepID=A0A061QSV5_9CHLO|mmetsp:Transcript_16975/g.40487  ORF Transcript_16975/g.40487 Transcript_16975/m.40487 type:complete len:261 (-) Transcript_16975:304-1086(-)